MIAQDSYGDGSVAVLGGIIVIGRRDLHICQGNVTELCYRDNVIEPTVVPYARRHWNAFIFQDDNARSDRVRVVQDHLQV